MRSCFVGRLWEAKQEVEMLHIEDTSKIVVGVDGSANSRDAVRWAFEQTGGTGAVVELVHAWHVPVDRAVATKEALPAAVERTPEVEAALELGHNEELEAARREEEAFKDLHERRAERLLERVCTAALPDPADRADVRLTAVEGAAGPALVRAAEDADLLVVSSHRTRQLTAAVLGSVSMYCTLHATCPVVVLPTRRRARTAQNQRGSAVGSRLVAERTSYRR